MQNLIPFINKLQEVFSKANIQSRLNLPQIVVLGEQSTGKSSVLENFVGRDFLPRGSGIVTRRPLVLQLQHSPGSEYALFGHRPEKYYNFDRVREEIEADTIRVAGSKKSISATPILLRVYSPNVVDITLVDLPGMTKIAVEDQPLDIDIQIKTMIHNYISNPNALILAVIPANIDLAVSDALKTAREVDPSGDRTIGVLTKIDMMDETTNCMDILLNKVYPLKLGYIGVVNRSQRDIEMKKDIFNAQDCERIFFQNHPIYKNHCHKLGSAYLQRFLNQQLRLHIIKKLPSLKRDLEEKFKVYSDQMKTHQVTPEVGDEKGGQMKLLMQLLVKYSRQINHSLGFELDGEVDTSTVSRGARINRLLFDSLPYHLRKGQNVVCDEEFRREVRIAIMNTTGIKNTSLSASYDLAFLTAVRKKINSLRPVLFQTLSKASEELKNCVKDCSDSISDYPTLQSELIKVTHDQLDQFEITARNHISINLDLELSFINIKHPDFLSGIEPFQPAGSQRRTSDLISTEWSSNNRLTSTTSVDNIVQRGYLTIGTSSLLSSKKEMYFTLDQYLLQWSKDEFEKQAKGVLPIKNIRVKELMPSKSKRVFLVSRTDGGYLTKDVRVLELIVSNDNDFNEWKSAFRLVGIYDEPSRAGESNQILPSTARRESSPRTLDAEDSNNNDSSRSISSGGIFDYPESDLNSSVEKIARFVTTYMDIVRKNQCDHLAKAIMYFLIDQIRAFLSSEITACLLTSNNNMNDLLGMSNESMEKRLEILRNYNALREGLNLINELISGKITDENIPDDNKPDAVSENTRFPKLLTGSSSGNFQKRPLPPRPINNFSSPEYRPKPNPQF